MDEISKLQAQLDALKSAQSGATPSAPSAPSSAVSMPHPSDPRLQNESSAARLAEDIASRISTGMGAALAEQFAKFFPAPQPAAPAAPTQSAPQQPSRPNVSDRGTARPTDLRDADGILNSRPLEMTGYDVDDLMLRHGRRKGLELFQGRVLAALGKIKIKPPR